MVLLSECMRYKKNLREGLKDDYSIIQGFNYYIEGMQFMKKSNGKRNTATYLLDLAKLRGDRWWRQ